MNNDTNNLNKEKIDPIQPINDDSKNISDSINNNVTPVPLQPIKEINPVNSNQVNVSDTTPMQSNVTVNEAPTNLQENVNVEQTIKPIDSGVNSTSNQNVVGDGAVNVVPQPNIVNPTLPSNAPVQNTPINPIVNPNGSVGITNQEVIPSITTGPVTNNNINGMVDKTNIGFVSTGKPLKKKKNPLVVSAIVMAILLVVGGLVYFVGYPFVMKTFFNKPKEAFTKGINNVTSYATTIADDTVHDKGIIDLKIGLDTNIDSIKQFSGFTYGVKLGVDPYNDYLEMGYNVYNQNTQDDFSQYYYYKKDAYYKRYSTYRDLIYLQDIDNSTIQSLFTLINDNKTQITKLNNNDTKYIINKISSSLIASINEDSLVKEDTSYTVNDKAIKATRNKYVMDKGILDNTKNTIINNLTSDDKSLEILAKIFEIDKSEVNTKLNNLINFNDNDNLTIGIITTGNKMNITGYEIKYNDDIVINYYKDNGNFVLKMDLKTNIDNETKENKIDVLGIKKDKITNVSIKVNDKEVAKLAVSTWTDDEKEFDYSIIDSEDKTITGSLKYTKNNSGNDVKNVIDFKIKNDDIYLNATLEINFDWTSEVANINTTAAKTISLEEAQQIDASFIQYISTTPLKVLFQTIGGDVDADINDYYDVDPSTGEIIEPIS